MQSGNSAPPVRRHTSTILKTFHFACERMHATQMEYIFVRPSFRYVGYEGCLFSPGFSHAGLQAESTNNARVVLIGAREALF